MRLAEVRSWWHGSQSLPAGEAVRAPFLGELFDVVFIETGDGLGVEPVEGGGQAMLPLGGSCHGQRKALL